MNDVLALAELSLDEDFMFGEEETSFNDPLLALVEGEDAVEEIEEENNGIELDDAVGALRDLIEDATDFMESEMFPRWEDAEAYYAGASAIPKVEGRSQVTSTEVRDAVRKLKPSAMRVLLQSTAIVEYSAFSPDNFVAQGVAQQQTLFCNQLFWRSGGYMAVLNTVHNAFLKKVGIMKACATPKYKQEYYNATNLDQGQFKQLAESDDIEIISYDEEVIQEGMIGPDGQPIPPVVVYKAEFVKTTESMHLGVKDVALFNFFVDDSATCTEDAKVIGERCNVTVSEAKQMGLEYDGDWQGLTAYSVEDYDDAGSSRIRRGYTKDVDDNRQNIDPSTHLFMLTEAYAYFDLEGTGIAQYYRFWLGGEDFKYIQHERVDENPYGVSQADPMPDAFFGRSIFDVLAEDQNSLTSLLRATNDNAHLSNNRRLAVHETLVNMTDVVNPKLGSPIRFRAPGMIQEIGVQSSVGSMLPLMDSLRNLANNKVGVTDASVGLDPDALQSTDKAAVQNTIELAQGQVELMVRNICETGLSVVFRKLLRLSILHGRREQILELGGELIPIDQSSFDPDLLMTVTVGLGSGNSMQKLQTLQGIKAEQEQIVMKYGLDNPICPFDKLFNTAEDMARLGGINNFSRYFNHVDAQLVKMLAEQERQAQAAAQPEPPSKAIVHAETIRAQATIEKQKLDDAAEIRQNNQETTLKTIELLMKDDLERDKMLQQLEIESSKIEGDQVNKQAVLAGQNAQRQGQMILNAAKQALAERQEEARQAEMQVAALERRAQQMQAQQAQAQAQQAPQAPQAPQQGQPPVA